MVLPIEQNTRLNIQTCNQVQKRNLYSTILIVPPSAEIPAPVSEKFEESDDFHSSFVP